MTRALLAAALPLLVAAQDPAGGWLGYAQALPPASSPNARLTLMSARWKVASNPRRSNSFYSPWFGCDTQDNLNLMQVRLFVQTKRFLFGADKTRPPK